MKKITFLLCLLITSASFAQVVLEDFETMNPTITGFEGLGSAGIVTDPTDGSNNVLELVSASSGQPWQGAEMLMQSNYIDLTSDITVTVDVFSDTAFDVFGKVENGQNGAPNAATASAYTTPNAWQTITLTFNQGIDNTVTANGEYEKFVLFLNWDIGVGWNNPAGDFTVLFDNITAVAGAAVPAPPACDDGIMNGDETGVDCGGTMCPACPPMPNIINLDPTAPWIGFANVFELDGTTFVFGQGWGVPDLKTEITATNIILKPNFNTWDENPADTFWTTGGVGTSVANKIFEANTFVEDPSLAGDDLTFLGNISGFDIPAEYTVIAFIKGLDPANGFADAVGITLPLSATGEFSISATAAQLAPGLIIQYGFQVVGPIADPATETSRQAITGVVVGASTLSTTDFDVLDFKVFPNPTLNNWNVKSEQTINSVQLYDVLGKQVLTLNPNTQNVTINSTSLNSGLYFAKISSDNGTKTIKLIKE